MTTSVIERQQQAAERLGVQIDKVHVIEQEMKSMREAGLLIDLDIHGISQFSARVTYEEMGIDQGDVRSERLRTGSKDLFPVHAKKLRSLEARARQNLEKWAQKVSAFGQWRWLPWTAYEEFRTQHDQIVAEMQAVVDDAASSWDVVAEENARYWARVAERAWRDMLSHRDIGEDFVILTTSGVKFERWQRDAFVDYVVARAIGKMPGVESIRQTRIDYKTSILYAESEITAEQAAATEARARLAEAQRIEAEAEVALIDIESQRRLAAATERARIEAIKAAEMEHARRQLLAMGSPIQEALDSLRNTLYQAVSSSLEGLRKNGGFKGRASSKLADLYQYWKSMNAGLLRDDELEQALVELNDKMMTYVATDGEARQAQIGDIEAQLVELVTLTNNEARRIDSQAAQRATALEF